MSTFESMIGAVCDSLDFQVTEAAAMAGEEHQTIGDDDEGARQLLGEYSPMNNSTGLIRLYKDTIRELFVGAWMSLKGRRDLDVSDSESCNVCRMVASKTYFHEQLHFMWDLAANHSQWFDHSKHQKSFLTEEALATSWGWYCSQQYGLSLGLDRKIVDHVTRYCFDNIKSRGYEDWKNWAHGCFFESEFANYFSLESIPDAIQLDPRNRLTQFFDYSVNNGFLCSYQIWDHKGGEACSQAWAGSNEAFLPFTHDVSVLHTPKAYYPEEFTFCDFRHRSLRSGAEIQQAIECDLHIALAHDVFLCHQEGLETLNGLVGNQSRSWKRVCLRHTKLQRSLLPVAMCKHSPNSIHVDDYKLQSILDKEEWGDCIELYDVLEDSGFGHLASIN